MLLDTSWHGSLRSTFAVNTAPSLTPTVFSKATLRLCNVNVIHTPELRIQHRELLLSCQVFVLSVLANPATLNQTEPPNCFHQQTFLFNFSIPVMAIYLFLFTSLCLLSKSGI